MSHRDKDGFKVLGTNAHRAAIQETIGAAIEGGLEIHSIGFAVRVAIESRHPPLLRGNGYDDYMSAVIAEFQKGLERKPVQK